MISKIDHYYTDPPSLKWLPIHVGKVTEVNQLVCLLPIAPDPANEPVPTLRSRLSSMAMHLQGTGVMSGERSARRIEGTHHQRHTSQNLRLYCVRKQGTIRI